MSTFFIALFFMNALWAEISLEDLAKKFSEKNHRNPPELKHNPYLSDRIIETNIGAVCGIIYENNRENYRTKTYPNRQAAEQDHASISHLGACGTCSSLQDLAVYLAKPDLTKPGKKCALLSWLKPASIHCFKKIGFSEPCATTWYYNARQTAKKCFWTCIGSFLTNEPSNLPNGSLNNCLQCDEDESGPIFKKMAGRTRRNSGLISSIKRGPDEIADIVHDYF